jgi:hypothetical protein
VHKGADGVYVIPCKNGGDIAPYNMNELCCFQSFKSARGVNNLKDKLPDYVQITQEGSSEIVFKFPENRLHEIALIVGARKKKKLSEQQRDQLRERFLKNTGKKHSYAA